MRLGMRLGSALLALTVGLALGTPALGLLGRPGAGSHLTVTGWRGGPAGRC